MSQMEFGIDLGTTNSCVARCEGDSIRVFQNNDLMNVTPSVVRILKNGRIIVGKRAYNAVVEDPANVAMEFKRWMGLKDKKLFPAAGREMSPEELSAEVLKAMRDDVQRAIGHPVQVAVITVPAAFGALQCDATARASQLAGIEQCALLQEPIAAGIAYGVTAGQRDQRWLIFDLGGGTLDIAIISTREGRLSVLEHRGDNLLGGKDVDRKITENFLLPALQQSFHLPDPKQEPDPYEILLRRLNSKAEEAKIDLSTRDETVVSLFDIGEDRDGTPLELELTLKRSQLEGIFEPMMRRMLTLSDEALAGARIEGKDLNQILLVGGPTQMPYLRAALGEHLKAPVNYSLDPMTVVARGAAVYAQTVESTLSTKSAAGAAEPGIINVQLAFDPVSSSLQTVVAGRMQEGAPSSTEVRIESKAGYWTSGWTPVKEGYFEVEVMLQEGKICPFSLFIRNGQGETLNVEPGEFTIRHGLVPSAPPLPHTISVEVVRPNGRVELDPLFQRNSPLPAEKRVQYRADRNLRPGEPGAALTVKLWEGEDFAEPEANEWVGNVKITSSMIRRPIPENSEIELFLRIDTSRLITVEIFIPHLNQHFSEGVYLAEREQHDERSAAVRLTKEIEMLTDRLTIVGRRLQGHPNSDCEAALVALRRRLEDLDIEASLAGQQGNLSDPDRARRLVTSVRDLRVQVAALEHRVGVDIFVENASKRAQETVRDVEEVVEKHGENLDRYEFEMRRKDLEQAAQRLDERGVQLCIAELEALKLKILFKHDWFWRVVFENMDKSEGSFRNPTAAQAWVAEGDRAIRDGKGDKLREAVRHLWELQKENSLSVAQQQALRTGLRT